MSRDQTSTVRVSGPRSRALALLERLEPRRLLSAGLRGGSLDASFGASGLAHLHLPQMPSSVADMVVLPDGKDLVLVRLASVNTSGPFTAVIRTNPDGSLDGTFGQGGVAPLTGAVTGSSLVLDARGKILVVGQTIGASSLTGSMDLVLERLNPDGSLDQTFAAGGVARTDTAGRDDIAVKVLVQSDGRIVVAGYEQKPFLPGVLQLPDLALVRYQPDGQLDRSFGKSGIVVTGVPGYQAALVASAALQADGKIVVAGRVYQKEGDGFMVPGSPPRFLAMRFLPDGSVDHSFGRGGASVSAASGYATDVIVGAGQKTYVAGSVMKNAGDFALWRVNSRGTGTLSSTGFERLSGQRAGNDLPDQVLQQDDGKLVLVGITQNAGIAQARFTAGGQLDRSFGARGRAFTADPSANSVAASFQQDSKLLAATTGAGDVLLARYVSYAGGIGGRVQEIPAVLSPPLGPVAGWTVFLDLNRNGRADPREPTAVTDGSGNYTFMNLRPGTYRVAQVFPFGWDTTPRTARAKTVNVAAGSVQAPIDFAVRRNTKGMARSRPPP